MGTGEEGIHSESGVTKKKHRVVDRGKPGPLLPAGKPKRARPESRLRSTPNQGTVSSAEVSGVSNR